MGEGDIEATLPAARNHALAARPEQRQTSERLAVPRASCPNKVVFVANPDDLSAWHERRGRGVPVKVKSPLVKLISLRCRSIVPGLLPVAYNLPMAFLHCYVMSVACFLHTRT